MEIKGLPITEPGNLVLSDQDIAAFTSREGLSGARVPVERSRTLGRFTGRLFQQHGHSVEEAVETMTKLIEGINTPTGESGGRFVLTMPEIIELTIRDGFEDEAKVGASHGGNN